MAAQGTAAYSRPVARPKIDLAKKAIQDNPLISVSEFMEQTGLSKPTAGTALAKARNELLQIDSKVTDRAQSIRLRQQEEALQVLDRQIARLESLPEILQTLRDKTFEIKAGKIVGIKELIKSYSKDGDPIYLTPGSIVKEYLEAEKMVLEQERLVTGIAAAEKVAASAAGKTDISIGFQIPYSSDSIREIRTVEQIN